jgi:Subunit ChlI of Mg-chelatase/Magnesium chelatase, subunit ChlI/Response regulator receiver domain
MIVVEKSEINQVFAGEAAKFCSGTVLVPNACFGYYFYGYPARSGCMVQRVATVAFEGIEARTVDVQVRVAPRLPAFTIVGLPDKAVSEAKERVRAALVACGLALPARRITVNLAPADLPKEGSHYDLPIALGLMAAIGAIPHDALSSFTVLGELGLDGSIAAVAGVLSAAIAANGRGEGLICPYACGSEAAWASPEIEIVAAQSLIQLANHFKGTQVLARPHPKIRERDGVALDLADIARGCCRWRAQSADDRSPGAGKSMLAARLPTILPPLSPTELLEVSMIASIAGEIDNGALTNSRPSESAAHASGPSANDCRQRGSGFRILAGGARSGCSLRPGAMDVQMPEMDGLEAARRIRAAEALAGDARTYMLALTANVQADHREAALSAGLDGLLIKPLNRERLREALNAASARASAPLAA